MGSLNTYFSGTSKTVDITAALLILLLPFSTALPSLLLIPLIVLIGINFKKTTWTKSYPILILAATIIILTVLGIYNGSFLDEMDMFSRYFLILVSFFAFTQVKNKKYCEYALLLGVLVAMLISSVEIGIQLWKNPEFLLDSGEIVNKLLLLERPYFGFLLTLSVFICLKNAEKSNRKYDYYLLSLLFAGFSIYISARLSMGLICLLYFVYLFKNAQVHRKIKIWLGILLALLFAIFMGLSDNLMSRMHVKEDMDRTIALIKDYEPRFVIWPCAVDIVQDEMNLLTGLKSYDVVEAKLADCYAETIEKKEKRQYYLDTKFNSHNQFLGFLLLGGMVPFILLIAMFIVALFSKNNSFELKLLFVLFLAFFLVENVFHRQLGCYLFGIFVALYSPKRMGKIKVALNQE